ncbi:MAG: hypothetical protein KDK40_00140, partial [Chlamydiia bacterium]|nr:hypothetical protein [Chlamydiia bacterium]
DDVLVLIFLRVERLRYLNDLKLCCKRFKALYWKVVNLLEYPFKLSAGINEIAERLILADGKSIAINHVNGEFDSSNLDADLQRGLSKLPIEKIAVNNRSNGMSWIAPLINSCKGVKEISINDAMLFFPWKFQPLSECHSLETLRLKNSSFITNEIALQLLNSFPHLSSLDLEECAQISDQLFHSNIFTERPLRHLGLVGTDVTEEGILTLAGKSPNLEALNIGSCGLRLQTVEFLCLYCPKIRSLKFLKTKFSAEGDFTVLKHSTPPLKCFESLSLNGVRGDYDRVYGYFLTKSLTSLEVLNCSFTGLKQLNDLGINCPHLRSLNLDWNMHSWPCDYPLRTLFSRCTRLNSITLSKKTHFSDSILRAMSSSEISVFILQEPRYERSISDVSIEIIGEWGKTLRHLELPQTMLTDAGVQTLVSKCSGLSTLNLSNCRQITDASIQSVAHHLPHLTKLYLRGCCQVTDAIHTFIYQGCRLLNFIDLRECQCIHFSKLNQWEGTHLKDIHVTNLEDDRRLVSMQVKRSEAPIYWGTVSVLLSSSQFPRLDTRCQKMVCDCSSSS